MEYRLGTCASCRQSYRIPASFEHDKARCKSCGGVVSIGPPESDAHGPRSRAGPAPRPPHRSADRPHDRRPGRGPRPNPAREDVTAHRESRRPSNSASTHASRERTHRPDAPRPIEPQGATDEQARPGLAPAERAPVPRAPVESALGRPTAVAPVRETPQRDITARRPARSKLVKIAAWAIAIALTAAGLWSVLGSSRSANAASPRATAPSGSPAAEHAPARAGE